LRLSSAALAQGPVEVHIETTLPAWSTNKAVLVLDRNPDTYFQTRREPDEKDFFTVYFSHPVDITSIVVETGDDFGAGQLATGVLEVSPDMSHFKSSADFTSGVATATLSRQRVKALRIRPTQAQTNLLVIREVVILPTLVIRKITQEMCVTVDTSMAPDMAEWGMQARDLCKTWYPSLLKLLPSKGFQPPLTTRIKFVEKINGGVGVTVDTDIQISAAHVRTRPDAFGVVIHELAHVAQGYAAALAENGGPRPPTWLMEGIADYIRFYHYEANGPPHRIDPKTASYTDSYQTTAMFFFWIEQTHARDFVKKLNADIRLGKYNEGLFKHYTGQNLDQLWQQFADGLPR
jgi:hypothetical protein